MIPESAGSVKFFALGNGLEAVSAIKRELSGVGIILLTIHDKDENLLEAIRAEGG
jgi:DNA-binding NarL/FixJ family response regulator